MSLNDAKRTMLNIVEIERLLAEAIKLAKLTGDNRVYLYSFPTGLGDTQFVSKITDADTIPLIDITDYDSF